MKVTGSKDFFLRVCGDGSVFPAPIPCSSIGTLLAHGAAPDPLFSGDDKEGEAHGNVKFEFFGTVTVTEDDLAYENVVLQAGGLDTICDVFVSGRSPTI